MTRSNRNWRKLIFFIAYEACKPIWGKNPSRYTNSVSLVLLAVVIHIAQVMVLLFRRPLQYISGINEYGYLAILFSFLGLHYLGRLIFPESLVSASMEIYENTELRKFARLLAWGYIIINFTLLIMFGILKSS